MTPPPTLSIVIPAFDEARRLPTLLRAVETSVAGEAAGAGMALFEVIVVDDGSRDATAELVAAAPPPVRLVRLPPPNGGKGRALRAGIREATGELVLITDVDLSTPVADVAQLHESIGAGADIAIGSRFVEGGTRENAPGYRRLGSAAMSLCVRLATGMPYRDTFRGFKLFRREAVQPLCVPAVVDGFAWDVELLLRAERAGLRIDEVGVRYHHDPASTMGKRSAARSFLDVLTLRARTRVGD
jgi:glycosyltransferase involved in cell wall biosynthesis